MRKPSTNGPFVLSFPSDLRLVACHALIIFKLDVMINHLSKQKPLIGLVSVSDEEMKKALSKRRKWKYVDMAPEIQERIKEVVKSGKYGFRSVAHFVDEAVKEYLRKLGYYP